MFFMMQTTVRSRNNQILIISKGVAMQISAPFSYLMGLPIKAKDALLSKTSLGTPSTHGRRAIISIYGFLCFVNTFCLPMPVNYSQSLSILKIIWFIKTFISDNMARIDGINIKTILFYSFIKLFYCFFNRI